MVPARMPGIASGNSTRRAIAPGVGAEVEGRLLDRAVDALDDALQRQHHEGQVDGGDADDHRRLGEHDLERLRDRRRRPSRLALRRPLLPNATIQPAARTALPTKSGSTTSMIRRFLWRRPGAGEDVGERKAHEEADRRRQRAATRTVRHSTRRVVGVGEELDVVLDRQRVDHELAGHELVQAVAEQDRERHEDADRDVDRRGPDEARGGEGGLDAPPPRRTQLRCSRGEPRSTHAADAAVAMPSRPALAPLAGEARGDDSHALKTLSHHSFRAWSFLAM